jgi:hypothetical protein
MVQKKGLVLVQGKIHHRNAKMGEGHLKIFFSRTTEPIFT